MNEHVKNLVPYGPHETEYSDIKGNQVIQNLLDKWRKGLKLSFEEINILAKAGIYSPKQQGISFGTRFATEKKQNAFSIESPESPFVSQPNHYSEMRYGM